MTIITKELIVAQLESSNDFPVSLSESWEWLGFSRKDSAVRSFLDCDFVESVDFVQSHTNAEWSIKAIDDYFMTVDCFKLWAMGCRTAKGKEVRLYYLEVEKEWKAGRSATYQISADHVAAYNFDRSSFQPFLGKSPVAAKIFLEWQNVLPSEAKTTPEFALPSAELQQAMNGVFLNLNRSGLAMNKLFHFIDRIPTMQRMDQESISEMAEALIDSGKEIARLQKENAELRRKAESRTQTPGRSPSPRTATKPTAKRTKPAPAKPAEVVNPKSRLRNMRSAEVVEQIALPPAKS